MLRKTLCFTIILISASLGIKALLFAADATGNPTIYKVTMIKMEMSQNSGTTWTTVADQQLEVDIASVNAGQQVGTWISGVTLPMGTYNLMRHTVSATFKMKGFVDYGGTRYYTSASGLQSIAPGSWGASGPANYAEQTITIPEGGSVSGGQFVATETDSLTISPGTSLNEQITFDVTNTLGLYQTGPTTYVFYPEAPVVDSVAQ